MKNILIIICFLLGGSALAQDPEKGHELELFAGYTYLTPTYAVSAANEWIDLRIQNHVPRYGLGYTFRKKKLRHQFHIASYSVNYDYDRETGDSWGWTRLAGDVSQQWLEVGGFGGIKVMDSVRIYPCIGFSFATPIMGRNQGNYSEGEGSTATSEIDYNMNRAPSTKLDFKIGGMYNWQFKEKMGINLYLFYSRSLIHPDLLGNDVSLGKLKENQFSFSMSLFYFIAAKE